MDSLDATKLTQALEEQSEWEKAVIFNQNAEVIASNSKFVATGEELNAYLTAYNSRDDTIGKGFTLMGDHYDVHRFHPPLLYGRRGGADEGEGIALCRVKESDDKIVFLLITYVLPTLSARAVPQMVNFCATHIGKPE